MSTPKKCLVIDVEATCWPKDRRGDMTEKQRRQSEVIEIGITFINLSDKTIGESVSIIVKPTTSEINEYCTNLTTLTPEFVEANGIPFSEAMDLLREEPYKCHRNMWASWGCYDRDILLRQCQREYIKSPFNNIHKNVKSDFCWQYGFNCGTPRAMDHMGLAWEGTHHRGVDDSRNVARVLLVLGA
jgi:inhibitor of KinA sporulation pathway (predicted exonuclease)